tara:strand:+ start:398 stop:712 length:315 start_codon:yes stop_codon:yes gene_type:complete
MSGVLVTDEVVLVTNIRNGWRLQDIDGDLKADSQEPLRNGYGVRTAFIGHDLHGLVWGPDDKMYAVTSSVFGVPKRSSPLPELRRLGIRASGPVRWICWRCPAR